MEAITQENEHLSQCGILSDVPFEINFFLIDSSDVIDGLLQSEEERPGLDDIMAQRFNVAHFLETIHDTVVHGDVLHHFASFTLQFEIIYR